jgi:hypothetical protein
MLNERKCVYDMDSQGNFPPGVRCLDTKEKNYRFGGYSRIHIYGLYNNKLNPTLRMKRGSGQYAMKIQFNTLLEALWVIYLEIYKYVVMRLQRKDMGRVSNTSESTKKNASWVSKITMRY